MNLDRNINKELDKIRNKIIDFALIFPAILGSIAYILSLERFFISGFEISFITDLIAVSAIVFITIFRKKFSLTIKGTVILVGLFFVIFVDLLQIGLLSANKVFIVLIPFFGLTVFNLKKTLYIFGLSLILFIIIAYLIITDNNPLLTEDKIHDREIASWLINFLILIVVTIVVLIITYRFNVTYSEYYKELHIRNIKLTESERDYREVFNGSTDAIFIHSLKGDILDVNTSMLNMYGYSSEEIKSISFQDLCSGIAPFNVENAANLINKAINEGKQVFDWHARKKNGILFWVEVALKKISLGDNERVLAIVRDINEKKEINLQLEKYKDKLELLVKKRTNELNDTNKILKSTNDSLSNQKEELSLTLDKLKDTQEQMIHQEKMTSLGILTSGVGHEINNPLNFIQTGIYSIESYFEEYKNFKDFYENSDQLMLIAKNMQVGVDRVSNIVNSLNQFSRQSKYYNEDCNIPKIIDNCLLILNNQYMDNIQVKKDYHSKDIILKGNEGMLHQVFINILMNSIQSFSEKGEITISTKLFSENLIIKISDTGSGISKENISRIFDPFFTTKDTGKGTGLGLSVTYGIIKDHKGSLEYKSELGKGTEAIIQLSLK